MFFHAVRNRSSPSNILANSSSNAAAIYLGKLVHALDYRVLCIHIKLRVIIMIVKVTSFFCKGLIQFDIERRNTFLFRRSQRSLKYVLCVDGVTKWRRVYPQLLFIYLFFFFVFIEERGTFIIRTIWRNTQTYTKKYLITLVSNTGPWNFTVYYIKCNVVYYRENVEGTDIADVPTDVYIPVEWLFR